MIAIDRSADALTAEQAAQVASLRGRLGDLARVPLPGHGATADRWRFLTSVAREDLAETRLVEGHLDALAILWELGRFDLVQPGTAWGVWAAEPPRLIARQTADGWHLSGAKGWCSGSVGLDAALVTAMADDGPRLFAVSVKEVDADLDSWRPIGMAATASHTMTFDVIATGDAEIGAPGAYVERPGFWHGGAGVAACWYGGADAVLAALAERVADRGSDIDALAFGRARARLDAAEALLRQAAAAIDHDPTDLPTARRTALGVRVAVEDAARFVLDTVNVALGAGAVCADTAHARRVADLTVYLRQLDVNTTAGELGRLSSPPPASPT